MKVLRKEAGFSQEDFAHRCGFARSYMSRIERGTSNLSLDGIERIADALDIAVEKLFINL
ncbi:MAG: helix-turn-helix transcriptional regulator [Duganella sp.]